MRNIYNIILKTGAGILPLTALFMALPAPIIVYPGRNRTGSIRLLDGYDPEQHPGRRVKRSWISC